MALARMLTIQMILLWKAQTNPSMQDAGRYQLHCLEINHFGTRRMKKFPKSRRWTEWSALVRHHFQTRCEAHSGHAVVAPLVAHGEDSSAQRISKAMGCTIHCQQLLRECWKKHVRGCRWIPSFVDQESIFYLRSRGINEQQAKRMMIEGFLAEVINKVKNENVRNIFYNKLNEINKA